MRYSFIYHDIIMYWNPLGNQQYTNTATVLVGERKITSLYHEGGHGLHSIERLLTDTMYLSEERVEASIKSALKRDMMLSPPAENHTTHISARRDSTLTKV